MARAWTYSEIGGGHREDEDAFAVRAHPADERLLLAALADGVGGQSGGGRAARLACQLALDAAAALPPAGSSGSRLWPEILSAVDRALRDDHEAGHTTLVGFSVADRTVRGASCGDSALWCFGGESAERELTYRQRKDPPVGSGEATFARFARPLVAPWLLLAVSDGVWKYVGLGRLRELASGSRGEALLAALQTAARLPGSGTFQDDFTLIAIQDSE